MHHFFFFIRYIPFWAIPILIISAEFSYIFWLKKKKIPTALLVAVGTVCLLSTIYYYWAGGPDRAVRFFIEFCQSLQ